MLSRTLFIYLLEDGNVRDEQKVLTEYIRHQIHHPENHLNTRYTLTELQQSIESSKTGRNYCMVYSNNKVYKGTPGKTTQEIIAEQNVPTGSDIAFINVFNNDIAIIEFLTSRNNMTQIVTAIKSAGQFKKIYSYVDQQGRQIRREASK